jgi:DNA-binding LytR/AlgR family response regulator
MKTLGYKMYKYKMMISHNEKKCLIWYKDIICIKTFAKFYIEIIVNEDNDNMKIYCIKASIHKLESQLPKIFFKCHRSAIVNIAYIESFDKDKINTIFSQLILPLTHSLFKKLQQFLFEQERLKIPNCSHCEKCKIKDTCKEITMFAH